MYSASTAMRRVAAKALRTSYQCTFRALRASRRGSSLPLLQASKAVSSGSPTAHYNPRLGTATARYLSNTGARDSSDGTHHSSAHPEPLRSSMYVRGAFVTLLSGLVAYGAWYNSGDSNNESPIASTSSVTTAATGAVPTRSVLVIGADELHTGTFVGDGPISKTTSNNERVVEMLSPEQATQRLRQLEQSVFVNRGQGVYRYDVSQLPSNDPIEDDHAEKIVEVPNKAQSSDPTDWMFWGVFDGHS